MADITVTCSLTIKKNNFNFTRSTNFTGSLTATQPLGPTPGLVLVTLAGVSIDLSDLGTPGWCWIENIDNTAANWFEYGIWDPEGGTFYPLGELSPGEGIPIKLSRNIEEEYGTGAGTTGANTNRLRLKAGVAACKAQVLACEW
jgi:hypothetical protein